MNSNRFKAVLFIVLFLLIVAIVVFIITGNGDSHEYVPASVQTSAPAETLPATATPTPYPTIHIADPTPAPLPTPTPTPEPTPEPSPEVQPAGTVLATGKFSSDSGTDGTLDIDAYYTVSVLDNDNVVLNISVDLKHYSLTTIGGPRLHFSAGEEFATEDTPEISYDGAQGQKTTTLGAHNFILAVSAGQSVSVPVQVQWDFGGSYHGVQLDSIACGGTVPVVR